MNHTPGPWYVDEANENIVVDVQDCVIATCTTPSVDPEAWCLANARLIAAAPALLEALEKIGRTQGPASIDQGVMTFEDGTYLDIGELIQQAKGGK